MRGATTYCWLSFHKVCVRIFLIYEEEKFYAERFLLPNVVTAYLSFLFIYSEIEIAFVWKNVAIFPISTLRCQPMVANIVQHKRSSGISLSTLYRLCAQLSDSWNAHRAVYGLSGKGPYGRRSKIMLHHSSWRKQSVFFHALKISMHKVVFPGTPTLLSAIGPSNRSLLYLLLLTESFSRTILLLL